MWEETLTNLTSRLSGWVSGLLSLADPAQAAAFVIALAAAWPLGGLLKRLLDTIETQYARTPWVSRLLEVANHVATPFAAWVLGRLMVEIFRSLEWGHAFLAWLVPFLAFWLVYRLFDALLVVNLPARQARVWIRQVLVPIVFTVAALHALGLLDNVLRWGVSLPDGLHITVGSIIASLAVVAGFIALSRGARQFLARVFLPQAGAEPALTQAISTLVSYAIIVVGLLLALNALGVPLTTLAVIGGGLSVGVGFGLREIVSNFVSGFILMFERSIGPGDVVRVGDTLGIVQTVGVRSMVIKTLDNVELVVPNSRFLTETVTNFTRTDPNVRVRVTVGATYNANPREVEGALVEAAQHPSVLQDPEPSVRFHDFGDSSLIFELMVWTDDAAGLPTLTSDLRYRIWDALADRDIEIPFPQRDIHIRSTVPLRPNGED